MLGENMGFMLGVWGTIALLIVAIAVEVGLRWVLGLGRPVLYQGDPTIGYLLRPNQRTRRRGNRIVINAQSMRGEAIRAEVTGRRLLLLGDSVANGGWWTDQAEIISQQLGRRLAAVWGVEVEVLNASANSWGPRNEWAYVERFGLFGSDLVLVLLNTDDLFATAPTALPVGRDRNYPDRYPILALQELYQRYGAKQKPIPGLKAVQQEGGDRVGKNLAALAQIHALAQAQGAGLVLAMTPLQRELKPAQPREYEQQARDRLTQFAQDHDLPYLDLLPHFNADPDPSRFYHDHIHLNGAGNRAVSEAIAALLTASLGHDGEG
jgi:lysophospholipase L1-like esterase